MPRSSTTFKPGHRINAGNRYGMTHGATVVALVKPVATEIAVRVREEINALPSTHPVDESIVETYAYLSAQVRILEHHFAKTGNGTLFTTRGSPRKGADFYLRVVNRQQDLAKVLAIGPLPRAQMLQAAAGARKDHHEVEAARLRMRSKLGLTPPTN